MGPLTVGVTFDGKGQLCEVTLPKRIPEGLEPEHLHGLLADLEEFPLAIPEAPPFTASVWRQLRKIRWGQAKTYGELAAVLGKPGASRAVGQACGANHLPLVIPCHRVLAQSGMGGFAFGLAWKAKLLELETERVE